MLNGIKRSTGEPKLYIATVMLAVAFVARFFLYDEMGLVKVLFGSECSSENERNASRDSGCDLEAV